MFRPKCRAIFRMMFEQVECTIGNAFNLRDLVLQEYKLVYYIVSYHIISYHITSHHIIYYVILYYIIAFFNTTGMSHLKITVCCVYRNNLLMVNNCLFETCRG